MAGMTAKNKGPGKGRSAEMVAVADPVAFGQTAGAGVGRAGWPAQTVHQDRARNSAGRGDERAS